LKTITYKNTPIHIGAEFSSLSNYLPDNVSSVVLLIDENVFAQSAYDFGDFQHLVIPAGESSKSMIVVEKLLERLVALGLDRSGFLVGVGGGVVCDLTGFIASIFMRGVRFGFVPTSLLAQIDASIGGKNGVNLGDYKNMIGTFTQPEFILVDLNFLETLPQQEFISGLAEVIKHACIQDVVYFEFIEQRLEVILAKDPNALNALILHSVRIKTEIVEADERESGLRKLLNFGHTFGHAIEKKYELTHGEAISLGMLLVNQIAVIEGRLKQNQAVRVEQLLTKMGLPTDLSFIDLSALENLVLKDKKRSGTHLDLILLHKIGGAQVVSKSVEEIQEMIKSMQ
jgi:3-dehydroquinate synthase